jgi:2-C-methyl-D-erythritol 2,4-cyclodiphosphate synthase
MNFRIGHGYDLHRLVEDRRLILGGVDIPFEKGLLGHSDADVAVHALMDALLGALALGDIGKHFPDNDPAYKGISSILLLEKVFELIARENYTLSNADITIIAQKPKLLPYIPEMRKNVAKALGCDISKISIKATTEEGLGFTGSGEAISAHAVCILQKNI